MVINYLLNSGLYGQLIKLDSFWVVWHIRDMQTFQVPVTTNGRMVIPAALRRQLGLQDGSTALLQLDDNGRVYLTSREVALRSAQSMLAPFIKNYSVDNFIADRRAEAERENHD
jgi:AbrB family transcriptional regulator (stage V sporulation protein T)